MEQMIINGHTVLLNKSDYKRFLGWKWHIHTTGLKLYVRGYPAGRRKQGLYYMHRVIMNALPGQEIDHRNGKGLDNRRRNLRFCSRSQNVANRYALQARTSQSKGVYFDSWTRNHIKKWRAEISKDGIKYRLGRFASEAEAAMAYDKKARELFPGFGHGFKSNSK